MAEKKAVIVCAFAAQIGDGMESLLKKAAFFPNYSQGEVFGNFVEADTVTAVAPEAVEGEVEKGTPLMKIDLGSADAQALSQALGTILDAVDRKTVLAVIGANGVAFYGTGINGKAGSVQRPVKADDIIPTLSYITDLPITGDCTGAVIYQALKNPNLKATEAAKLKEAITRLEGVIARDNREPWDKHDCA